MEMVGSFFNVLKSESVVSNAIGAIYADWMRKGQREGEAKVE